MPTEEMTLADHACLAVVAERPTHGWAIVKLLAPDGELGRIWSLSRPLTYRALDRIVAAGLATRLERGRRAELRVTDHGRATNDGWLDRPVEHLRDLRTEFLLKLTLCERAGRSTRSLVERQLEQLTPTIDALTATPATDVVDMWRQESAETARRFLDRALRA